MNTALAISEVSRPVAKPGAAAGPVEDRVLCHCEKVAESTVRSAVESGEAGSLEEVSSCTGAGTGCRACHCRIHRVLMGLPAQCGGRFDMCGSCGCVGAICKCEAA